jgi:hypothetical protein
MSEAFDISTIKPDEQHSLREWEKILGLGEANIRTALRKHTLQGQLVQKKNEDGTDTTTKRWEMTGQQIIDWRTQKVHRGGTGQPKIKGASSYRVKLTLEQAPIVQQFLDDNFPGIALTLPKPKAKEEVAEVATAVDVPGSEPVAPAAVIDAPVQRKNLFGKK